MRIFGSEVHDTAFVFIMAVMLQCLVGGAMGSTPSESFSKFIVFISAGVAFIYWFITYRHNKSPEK